MEYVCKKKECTGCCSCYNICPAHCISMQEDEYGYIYPNIDSKKCVGCGLCRKICPSLDKIKLKSPKTVYAAVNKNVKDYKEATSGGIATLFSKMIASKGGVVYGAAVCDEFSVKHIRVTEVQETDRFKGSKYVQSMIGNTFKHVKEDLECDKQVLFIGTPCQVAGLYKFLGKEYKKLYTCDIVCHGVPPYRYLKEHLRTIGVFDKGRYVSFRSKCGYYLAVKNDQKILYQKKNFYDIYYIGFLKGLTCRESCYDCKYAQKKRISNITLGDFWGFNSMNKPFPVEHSDGLSLVMINDDKGKELFNMCRQDMVYQEREIDEALNGNKQLRKPSIKHKNYYKFRAEYKKMGFEKAAKKMLWKERVVYAIIDKINR